MNDIEVDSIKSMTSLFYAYGFHIVMPEDRHFHPDTERVFSSHIQPIIDSFIASTGLDPEPPAQRIYDILKKLYDKQEESDPAESPDQGSQSADEGNADTPRTSPAPSDTPQSDTPESTRDNPSGEESQNGTSFEERMGEICESTDIERYLQTRIECRPERISSDDRIKPHRDRIIDLHLADTWKRPEALYQKTITANAAIISAYRDLFSRILISTKRSRSLQTFQGTFNSRKTHRLISSPTPRLYTTTIPGQTAGYDVSILVDSSGSMNECDSHYISKFQYAMQAMMILSESLHHLPGINLEVLAFTADRYFNVPRGKATACPGDNVIYTLKAFHQRSTGDIPSFHEFARHNDLLCNNFDLAAVKVASRRLLSYNTRNRKLLIVLSDGYPACENNSSPPLLRSYLLELSKRHPIFGIGIQNSGITSLYPYAENITDLGCLQSVVLGRLREFILTH
jgi:cobalamin biosynthesis protein CobT